MDAQILSRKKPEHMRTTQEDWLYVIVLLGLVSVSWNIDNAAVLQMSQN